MPDETKTPQDKTTEAAVESEAQAAEAKPADAEPGAGKAEGAESAEQESAKSASAQTETSEKDAEAAAEAAEAGAMKLDKFDEHHSEPTAVDPADDEESSAQATPLEAQLEQLKADLAAKEDQLLRAIADVQNARRRAERDRREGETYGGRRLARDLLSVYDNIESALQYASDSLKENEADFFKGVELTRNGLIDAFAKHQISPIKPEIGDKFDPNLHQAMFEAPAPGAESGAIIQVMQHGFRMAEQLLRPAMVGVAKAAPESAGSKPKEETDGDADEKAASA